MNINRQALKIFRDLLLQKEYLGVYLKAWNKHNDKSPYWHLCESVFYNLLLPIFIGLVCSLVIILVFGPLSTNIESSHTTTQAIVSGLMFTSSFWAVKKFRPVKNFCIAVAWFENAKCCALNNWNTIFCLRGKDNFPDLLLEALQECLAQKYTAPIVALEKKIAQVSVFPMKVYWIERRKEVKKKRLRSVIGIISSVWPKIAKDDTIGEIYARGAIHLATTGEPVAVTTK